MGQKIQRQVDIVPVTIANNAALSTAVRMAGNVIAAIHIPAAWTAAALTFQASLDDGVTWMDVYDDGGTELSIAAGSIPTASTRAIVNATILEKLAGLAMFRLRSGTSAVPVNQGAQRVITLVLKG